MQVLSLYTRVTQWPCGHWLFSKLVCRRAPYFASIRPQFRELRAGLCIVGLRKRRAVENHLGTVHAIAMANLCELAGGMLMEVSLPATMRWIPRGMTIEYLRKATTDVSATARLDKADWTRSENVGVPVSVIDHSGVEVVRAVITMYVSPKS